MKTAIILHGMPDKEDYLNPDKPAESNSHWLPWIQKQLILREVLAQAIEFPEPYEPVYQKWREVFEQFKIDSKTMLIGHSCGAGFLVRWLSENKKEAGTVVLIAPWLDPFHELKSGFFDFKIDSKLTERVKKLIVFYSESDHADVISSAQQIKEKFSQADFRELEDMGHFTFKDMKTDEFPELLEVLKGEF